MGESVHINSQRREHVTGTRVVMAGDLIIGGVAVTRGGQGHAVTEVDKIII